MQGLGRLRRQGPEGSQPDGGLRPSAVADADRDVRPVAARRIPRRRPVRSTSKMPSIPHRSSTRATRRCLFGSSGSISAPMDDRRPAIQRTVGHVDQPSPRYAASERKRHKVEVSGSALAVPGATKHRNGMRSTHPHASRRRGHAQPSRNAGSNSEALRSTFEAWRRPCYEAHLFQEVRE